MKYIIDTENHTLTMEGQQLPLYSKEAFAILSTFWLKVGWNAHYHYTFTWLGRPILQLPEDVMRLQEVIWELKPDVIIETGIALGGSLLFYASLCALIGKGRVIGIDIDLRPHNKAALETHALASFLTCIDGSSIDPVVFNKVRVSLKPGEKVCVILDANHSKEHVLRELGLYSQLITKDSYIVIADGFKQSLADTPRGKKEWSKDNPIEAVEEFLDAHPEFVLEYPERRYNRSEIRESVTHFQKGWLRRK
jgi:cephalosporin hydroxylase